MDMSNKDPENKDSSEEVIGGDIDFGSVSGGDSTTGIVESAENTSHDEDNKPKVEITSDSSEQNFEDQNQQENEKAATFIKPTLPASDNDNTIKVEDKMDTEPSAEKNDSDPNDLMCSQMTVVLPLSETTTPKTNEKKPRVRASSEFAQTPTANKVARLTPRATRSSQNPDFAAKQRKFLNRVHDPIRNNNSDGENSQSSPVVKASKETKPRSAERKTPVSSDAKKKPDKESTPKRPADSDEEGSVKKKKTKEPTKVVGGVDSYCWRCHRDGVVIRCDCAPCPRVYHVKCLQLAEPPDGSGRWMCPECSEVTQAEDTDTRTRAMRMLTLDQLCNLLRFALNRMKNYEGAEDFSKPVDPVQFPHYRDYIVKPMDLSQLERNLKSKLYGSTEAFLADAKWIVHNSIIFNSVQSKFTNTARALLKLCRQEMHHIENCPDCYLNSHTRSTDSWFTEACRRPHILVWAKLKGYPCWPAKVMSVNKDRQVDVRFFGAHDRAWIPLNQCFLYSKLSPTPATNNKNKRNLEECMQEVEIHIKRLRDKFGRFEHAPYKTPYDPENEDAQLLMMLPQYESKTVGKRSRLSLHHDGARKSLGRKTISPEKKPTPEEAPADSTKQNGVSEAESPDKQGDQPMVFIPKMTKGQAGVKTTGKATAQKQGESDVERTPPNKQNNASAQKKKTPLTAAAKKCFATDKICAKCSSCTTTVNEDSLCSICSNLGDKPEIHQGKRCERCATTITMMWLTDAAGNTVCSSCSYSERFKKDERGGDPNSTVRGTVTVHRKRPISGEGDQADDEMTKPSDPTPENVADTGQSEAGQSKPESEPTKTAGETGQDESPAKFVIQKGPNSEASEPIKKVSIVDRLQEKLCFTVIEALKDQMTPEEVQAIEQEKEIDSSPEKINDIIPAQDSSAAVVVLHDLRNDKEMMDRMRVSEENKTSKKKEDETHTPSEVGSEVETDVSSCGDSDVVIAEESKRKKKKNINNVVQNLKERKSSVDERSEQGKKLNKEHNTVMLDDVVEECSILIIDEGESSDSKKSSGEKSDKSRRKGIPAKVHSRSSTSTESSDDVRLTKSRSVEVLDETSGHFRRSSGEIDRPVTITVVTDDEKPQKKVGKEIRSVNISKSLSLSVIKDSASGLEMECLESDADDLVIVDSVQKVFPKPTARKTLPNPPRLANLDKRPASVPPSGLQQPPPLVSLKQPRPAAPARLQASPAPAPAPRTVLPCPVLPPVDVAASPRATVGPAHAKLEEVVQKVVTFVRSTFEEMLCAATEAGGGVESSAALREAQQLHQLELERLKWQHQQEKAELKHNTDLVVMEIRSSMEADKQRALLDLKHKVEIEKEQAVSETKRKQWCAYCQKEAQLYCCWNTAYCSYNCQQEHWAPHMNDCRNKQQSAEEAQRPSYAQMHDPVDVVQDPIALEELTTVVVKKRKRCGQCVGCTTEPCGGCYPCLNRSVHSACVHRRCSLITRKNRQKSRPLQHELMPPPSTVPPFRHPGYPPQQRGFHHRNHGPQPLFYPPEGLALNVHKPTSLLRSSPQITTFQQREN